MFAETLEKVGWHFQPQLLASKGQPLPSKGTSWEVTNHEVERSAWGRRLQFFSQRWQYLQGSICQVRNKNSKAKNHKTVSGPHLPRTEQVL